MALLVFPVDWVGLDQDQGDDEVRYEIHCYGKTPEGASACVRIRFVPYFFVKVPETWSTPRQQLYVTTATTKVRALQTFSAPVKRTPLLGFTNNAKLPFVQLAFETLQDFRKAKYSVPKMEPGVTCKTFEASLDPLLRFFHVRGIDPAHWISFTHATAVDPESDARVSRCQEEYVVDFRHVSKAEDCTLVPPLVIASWDLECVSAKGVFPKSSVPEDHIITIGTAFQRLGDAEPYLRSAIALRECGPISGVEVEWFETEAEAINAWLDLLAAQDVDVMVGYNTTGFDFKYLDGRAQVCTDDTGQLLVFLDRLGKSLTQGGLPMEKSLSSNAYGDNKYFYLTSPGVLQLDLLQIFRKELKLESYSLANVSKKFLDAGEEKIDLKPSQIFAKFEGTAADRAEIAAYCIRDVELPLKLMGRLSTLENVMEMANATCVPIEFLQTRGQQIRVYSLLTRKARSMGFVAPDMDRAADTGKYEGATVLEAKKGAYFDVISALDYASLYPSIMRAHNMCPSTLVMEPRYAHVPGVSYFASQTGHKFAQDVVSVVPTLLAELAQFRSQAKKDMAKAKERGDKFQATLFNAKQLAFKVSMNSIYGFFGATKGMFPCVAIASSVTATGRGMIEHSKKLAETLVPGTEVIYGDSVAEYTPTIVRFGDFGAPTVQTFEELASGIGAIWTPDPISGKEWCVLPGLQVWTDEGFVPVERLIRHACSKKMVRVFAPAGTVDVTADHSLCHALTKAALKPSECIAGLTELLTFDAYPDFGGHLDPEPPRDGSQKSAAITCAWGADLGMHPECLEAARLDAIKFSRTRPSARVASITPLHYTGTYVYDMTTSNHRFAAGVGRLVVHNTDSIMCKFAVPEDKRYDMQEHFRIAEWVAEEITKTFKPPIHLEFEKCYYPYLLFCKKRYAGKMFTKPESYDYIDVKGLQLVRRDNAPIVKDVSTAILDALMHDRSPANAIAAAQTAVLRVLTNEEPLHKFVISKALKANYANPASHPHVSVANKILQRRGYPVATGERVAFVFVEDKDKYDGLLAARAEDPDYVKEHPEVTLDGLYYITNQLMSPITTLLELVVPDVEKTVLGAPGIKERITTLKNSRQRDIKEAKRVRTNQNNKQHEITRFFFIKE